MFRLLHSTGIACATLLLTLGCLPFGEARPQDEGTTPFSNTPSPFALHTALTEGSPARVEILLDRGADIEARNAEGATPLITASRLGNLALVSLLLEQGAQLDATDRNGNTALHEASFHSHTPCVDALLAAGAGTSARNRLGFTPLHQAVRRFWETRGESKTDRLSKQIRVIDRLLRSGADPDTRDNSGRTPRVLAAENDNASLQQAFIPAPTPVEARLAPMTNLPVRVMPTRPPEQVPNTMPTNGIFEEHIHDTSEEIDSQRNDRHRERLSSSPTATDSPSQAGTQHERNVSTLSTDPAAVSPALPAGAKPDVAPNPSTPSHPLAPTAAAEGAPDPEPMTAASSTVGQPAPETPAPQQTVQHASDLSMIALSPSAQSPIRSEQAWRVERIQPAVAPARSPAEDAVRTSEPLLSGPGAHDPRPTPPVHEQAFRRTARMGTALAGESPHVLPAPVSAPSGGLTATAPPATPRAETTPPLPHSSRIEPTEAKGAASPRILERIGIGLALGWTHNLGPRRVESVSVVNRIVRIDDERNDLLRVMPELHVWIDRWDEQRWSWGPFLAVAPGSRIIDAVGGGLMLGYRPHRSDRYSFNLGIGGTLDLDARVLGDGIVANQPLPPRETNARTKQTTAAGLLILFSVGWDLSASRATAPLDQ